MTTETPTTPAYSTDVARSGDVLIVPRGGDISQACMCCNGATARHYCRRLSRSRSGSGSKTYGSGGALAGVLLLLDLVVLLIYFLIKAGDRMSANQRKLTYGLCQRHIKMRRWMIAAVPGCLIGSVVLYGWMFSHIDAPIYFGLPATILATGLLVASFIVYGLIPGPSLGGENPTYLWIKGCGVAFLQTYSAQTKP